MTDINSLIGSEGLDSFAILRDSITHRIEKICTSINRSLNDESLYASIPSTIASTITGEEIDTDVLAIMQGDRMFIDYGHRSVAYVEVPNSEMDHNELRTFITDSIIQNIKSVKNFEQAHLRMTSLQEMNSVFDKLSEAKAALDKNSTKDQRAEKIIEDAENTFQKIEAQMADIESSVRDPKVRMYVVRCIAPKDLLKTHQGASSNLDTEVKRITK